MRKKERQDIKMATGLIASQVSEDEKVCQSLQPVIMATLLQGYYMGIGYDLGKASIKAEKALKEITNA